MDNYSPTSSSTPHGVYSQWESIEQQQQQQQQQQQIQGQVQLQDNEVYDMQRIFPQYPEEIMPPMHVVHSQQPSPIDNTPIRLQPVTVPQQASGTPGRQSLRRSPARHARTPYERAPSTRQLRADFNPDLRGHSHSESVNLPVRFTAPTTPASHASTPMPPFAGTASLVPSSHTSPVAAHQAVSVPTRLGIRADAQYEYPARMWHIVMELPGVKKSDIDIELWTNLYNHNRQVTVSGVSRPVFPTLGAEITSTNLNPQMNKRERRYGEFLRSWSVPPQTQPEDIDATMEDGILTLRINCKEPAPSEDRHKLTIG